MTADEIDLVMRDVGPLDDAILEVLRLAEDSWLVRFEAADVEVERDEDGGSLVLSTAIGAPPAEDRLRIYEALLLYNAQWRASGGVRMTLEEPGGDILQVASLPAAALSPRQVAVVAVNLAERAAVWRSFFEAAPEDAPDPLQPGEFMIRV